MPTDLMPSTGWPCSTKATTAPSMHFSTEEMISRGSCSCQLKAYKQVIALCSRCNGDIPGLRIDLLELDLMRSDWLSTPIEDQEPRTCRSLVDRANKTFLCAAHLVLL